MNSYVPHTKEDIAYMLESIGAKSLEELFGDIPEALRLKRQLNLGKGMSELELSRNMAELSKKNLNTDDLVCFMGAGAYDHYIPSIIKHIASRSEFYTAYTPYQPEISQGTLQVIFEYQTMIANLTGMEVANASMYDGATACAEAAILSAESTKRKAVAVSKSVHPETRKVLKTYMRFRNIEVLEIDTQDGVTDTDKLKSVLDKNVAAVIVQNPNFFGIIENMEAIEKLTHENKSMLVASIADPISLGIIKSPGELGADIVVGEGQSFGNSLNFGGPYLGFMAVNSKLMRKMPGRIVGQTNDVDGKRAFVLTLQAREQHIRREKATSNICSNQALNALIAAAYLITMGKEGIREAAEQSLKKAHYAYNEIIKTGLWKPVFNKPFFKEFALKSGVNGNTVNKELLKKGILGGYELNKDYEELDNSILFCVTEKRTKTEIDNLVKELSHIAGVK